MEDKIKAHIEDLYTKVDLQASRIDTLINLITKMEKDLNQEKNVTSILLDKVIEPTERDKKTLAKAYEIIEEQQKEIERLHKNRIIISNIGGCYV